jgi:hypothetical protein
VITNIKLCGSEVRNCIEKTSKNDWQWQFMILGGEYQVKARFQNTIREKSGLKELNFG